MLQPQADLGRDSILLEAMLALKQIVVWQKAMLGGAKALLRWQPKRARWSDEMGVNESSVALRYARVRKNKLEDVRKRTHSSPQSTMASVHSSRSRSLTQSSQRTTPLKKLHQHYHNTALPAQLCQAPLQ
jgi:hypothetical protein